MSKLFLLPIGFHENIPFRILTSQKTLRGDIILVYTCKPVVRGASIAFEKFKAQCLASGLSEPRLVELECTDPYKAIVEILDSIGKINTPISKIIVGVGAGLRIISHYLAITLTILEKKYTLHYIPESGITEEVVIDEKYIETIMTKLSTQEQEVLELIVENPGITSKEIALKLDKKEKTISNITTRLKNKNLITRKKRKNYPTKAAQTLIYAKKLKNSLKT